MKVTTELLGRRTGTGVLGLLALAAGIALLAPPAARAEDPAQAVSAARLSSVDGQVQISQGNQVLADQAVVNTPLFQGAKVATADNGRAEIQLDDGSVARLSPNSALTLTVLRGQGGSSDVEITLDSGLGYFELQGAGQAGTIQIRFGDAVVTAGGFAVLRINLDNAPGELAVFSGNAHLEHGAAVTADLHGGESVALNGADPARYIINENIEPDSWDTWNSDRDQVLSAEASAKTGATNGYPDSGNPAWNDLDANGNWYNVPGQGNVWSPYDAGNAGFDPYGNGNWVWTPGYGYAWASDYSWGFLPYQCGLWNYYDAFGWGWAPGLGGCSPWWGGGFFAPNIGVGFGGYRPPFPPRPRPHGPTPMPRVGGATALNPVIAVDRHPSGGNAVLPPRSSATPVKIAGYSVQALRPLSPRPQYNRTATAFVNRAAYPGASPAAGQSAVGGPSFPNSRPGVPANSSTPRPSGASSSAHATVPRPAPPNAGSYHPPSGGGFSGGGGASHSSGGGGSHR
jgi:FecR protein